MTKSNLIEKLAPAVAEAFANGETLPAVVAKTTKTTKTNTIHIVSRLYWSEVAKSLGPLDPSPASIYRARKSGERREIVAERAGVTVARVREIETSGRRSPVYTGRGTRAHLAAK